MSEELQSQIKSHGQKIATTALVIGISGIVLTIIPYAGIILGILAILFAIVAKNKKANAIIGLILGIISIVVGIISTLLVLWILNGSSLFDTTRSDAVTAQVNEKKNFTINETAKIGPVDYKVTRVERNASGSTVNTEWIVITATATLNGSPELGTIDDLGDIKLNGLSSSDYESTYPDEGKEYSATVPTTYEYTFKSARSARALKDPLVLTYTTRIAKTDSPLFGSEGAERAKLTYTISLE